MLCKCSVCGFKSDLPSGLFSNDAAPIPGPIEMYPITSNGKLNGWVAGFICARCLRQANDMRIAVKSRQQNVQITQHAVDRFLERQVGEQVTGDVRVTILRLFSHARQQGLGNQRARKRDCSGQPESRFFHHAGWVFVTTGEEPLTILTMYRKGIQKSGYGSCNGQRARSIAVDLKCGSYQTAVSR